LLGLCNLGLRRRRAASRLIVRRAVAVGEPFQVIKRARSNLGTDYFGLALDPLAVFGDIE
jgi:hypothetical protein